MDKNKYVAAIINFITAASIVAAMIFVVMAVFNSEAQAVDEHDIYGTINGAPICLQSPEDQLKNSFESIRPPLLVCDVIDEGEADRVHGDECDKEST